MSSVFETRVPKVAGNQRLRLPQMDGFQAMHDYYSGNPEEREIGIILPVGCGKSGLITLSPFAVKSKRTLVIAPGLSISSQLFDDFDPTLDNMFYIKCHVLDGQPYPEPAEIRGNATNVSDLEEAEVVITNIQQLQGTENRWLQSLPSDFFDLILFDEAHHNVAESWDLLRRSFPEAKIVNFSATPRRADGQVMAGRVIYSFPIVDAIEHGYVKRLKAVVLNPRSLRYVRRQDGEEVQVSLEEVRRLGETDADFRRSIVTSEETLYTIVDASIRALQRIRRDTENDKHKIIASALNFEHCIQVVEAYQARGYRAAYVHSRQESAVNQRILERLKNNELDVIVQVRKLGEGFDHPFLSVAAVFSVFRELSPFVQFVGRIMRAVDQNDPSSVNNQGTVVFHAGSNIARLWTDFQEFSQADQEFFDRLLLPLEQFDFSNSDEIEIDPLHSSRRRTEVNIEVRAQEEVSVMEIPLILEDDDVKRALDLLQSKGVTIEDIQIAYQHQPLPTTRQRERQAARAALDDLVRNEVGYVLRERGINLYGRDLDRNHIGRNNFVVLKAAVDGKINEFVGHEAGTRHEFTRNELESIRQNLRNIVEDTVREVL